jgi:hypothetical protein
MVISPVQAEQQRPENNPVTAAALIDGCPMFPESNIWNIPVNNLPVHARSDQWVNTIGRNTGFHMDFGSGLWAGGPIGIPYNVVGSGTPKLPVSFYYPSESDAGPYPIPSSPLIEHGSDHHILIVDNSTCTLYELFDASYYGGAWHAGSGAIWNLNSNALRPDTWTSADAAGLPILAGLVRYDEVASGEIDHAIRFTAQNTNSYIWPARHLTSGTPGVLTASPPMGARFRLKASFNISGYPAQMQVVLQAMKTYGIILADNGSNWYISGAPDERWDNDMLHLLDDLTGDDFEAVDTSGLMVDYDSGATGVTISGNVGVAGASLSYMDGTLMSVTSQANGSYSLSVPRNWDGTVTPSHPCYTFNPANHPYTNVITDQTGQNFTANFNAASGCANINVSIGGVSQGSYGVPPQGSQRVTYPLDAGPVKVMSTNAVPLIAALRDAFLAPNGQVESFAQLMGLPEEQLSDTYYFPAYNNVTLDGQLRFANVDTIATSVTVTIGGQVQGTYPLQPNESQRISYPLDNGPVVIQSSNGANIIAALRDASLFGSQVESFVQLMGLPKEQLSDTYYFPAYNNLTLDGQLRFANVDSIATNVTVTIGGVDRGTYPLQPNQSHRVSYPLDTGPVVLQSSNGAKIIAALRDAYLVQGKVESFAQLMGLPLQALSDTYVFPAYNNLTLDGQLRFGNVDSTTTDVTVTIGGVDRGTYTLQPNQSHRVNYPLDSGPVVITSSNGAKIIAALRDAYLAGGGQVVSFVQLMGLPQAALSDTYYFPAYNNITLSGQLRFGVP